MYELKLFFKSKEFIWSFIILTIMTLYNMYTYFDQALMFNKHVYEGINAFSFWKYVRAYHIGSIVVFIVPVVMLLNSLTMFFENITSNILNARLLKENL